MEIQRRSIWADFHSLRRAGSSQCAYVSVWPLFERLRGTIPCRWCGFVIFQKLDIHLATAEGLSKITAENTATAMQVSDSNPMVGIEGRASLLFNLSKALKESPQFFGSDGRPGNIIGMSPTDVIDPSAAHK